MLPQQDHCREGGLRRERQLPDPQPDPSAQENRSFRQPDTRIKGLKTVKAMSISGEDPQVSQHNNILDRADHLALRNFGSSS